MVFGGRNHLLLNNVKKFLDKIRCSGVTLIFSWALYFDEGIPWDKEALIMTEYNRARRTYTNIFDKIDNNEKLDESDFESTSLLGLDIESIAREYGPILLKRRYDVLNYINECTSVLAILSKDRNYLMYDYHPTQFWMCETKSLDIHNFSVKRYDVQKFDNYLKLSQQQKVLFATILRTYYSFTSQEMHSSPETEIVSPIRIVNGKCLTNYHRNLLSVAKYVRENFPEPLLSTPDFEKIRSDVFNDTANQTLEEVFNIYYEKYNVVKRNFIDINHFDKYREEAELVYNVLVHRTICLPVPYLAFIDIRSDKPFIPLILPIYRRNMGIVLQHQYKNATNETFECAIRTSVYFLDHFPSENVTPIYPEGNIFNINAVMVV